MTLGEKILQLRKERGLSPEQLASQITVSRQAISKWELREAVPDVDNIVQLSKLFGVSTDYLLNDEYENDKDISAVKVSNENSRTEHQNTVKRSAYWFIGVGLFGVGLFGVLTLWILSSIIPASKTVSYNPGGNPIQEVMLSQDESNDNSLTEGEHTWYRNAEVRGELVPFLNTYNLSALFAICCAVGVVGLIIIVAYPFLKDFFRSDERMEIEKIREEMVTEVIGQEIESIRNSIRRSKK
jgi:transcriptional regulator with XRE-family HTH domain